MIRVHHFTRVMKTRPRPTGAPSAPPP